MKHLTVRPRTTWRALCCAGLMVAALTTSSPVSAAPKPAAGAGSVGAETSPRRAFDRSVHRFLEALWRIDPEAALAAGRYERAAVLAVPDAAARARRLAFTDRWLATFAAVEPRGLTVAQRTDLGLLTSKLESDRWQLTVLREHAWNPAQYGVAGGIDLILNTEYAPKPQRLRALLRRIDGVPAYYRAAQASIDHPTREHTQLAIAQAPGNLAVLDDLAKAVQESELSRQDKTLYATRLAAARAAVEGYRTWLTQLDSTLAASGEARPYRLGRELYETKFGFDIQSSRTAEQTYRKALEAREALLTRMDALADELWAANLGDAPKPADRTRKIAAVIDKLSARHVAREDFFKEIRAQIPRLQAFVAEHDLVSQDTSKPLIVRETPVYERGVAGAGIEAPGPYRPQDRTYYNVTPLDDATPEQAESSLREYNLWMLQILNIHEAIPGHYTQLIHANRSPSLVKSLFGNGAMVEGWAVYGERMMLEAGYGDNAPEMWLMWCKWNLRSVTNTILDYSVHVLDMQEPEAIDLLTRQAFQTASEAREKWRRVQLTSVQLTSYFSGYSEIMDLRESRRAALGPDFRLKDFHEQFLSYGNAPVRVIGELMQ